MQAGASRKHLSGYALGLVVGGLYRFRANHLDLYAGLFPERISLAAFALFLFRNFDIGGGFAETDTGILQEINY